LTRRRIHRSCLFLHATWRKPWPEQSPSRGCGRALQGIRDWLSIRSPLAIFRPQYGTVRCCRRWPTFRVMMLASLPTTCNVYRRLTDNNISLSLSLDRSRPVATDVSPCVVCVLTARVSCAKMAEPTMTPFRAHTRCLHCIISMINPCIRWLFRFPLCDKGHF